jgi:hypothetical protein
MAPSTNKKGVAGKQQTLLNFKTTRKNTSANLKPSKSTLVSAAAPEATTRSIVNEKRPTRADDASSVELDASTQEEISEPEEIEPDFESVSYTISLSCVL